MLEKFLGKFRKEDARPEEWKRPQYLGTRYDPSLVLALTHQHRSLSMLLVEASSAAQLGAYDEIAEILEQFENALADHLHQERTRLHPYLAEHIKGDGSDEVLAELHAHSANTGHSVEGFLQRYRGTPLTMETAGAFEQAIEVMSEEFCQELEREEAMFYTLYLPPEAY